MTTGTDHYANVLEQTGYDPESLTLVIASGATPTELAAALGVDTTVSGDDVDEDDVDTTTWGVAEATGGALAVETSGYGDPTLDALREISRGGRTAAVVRSNIQAHYRFGFARNGEVVFDKDEYIYVDDLAEVPNELRELVDLVHVDLASDDESSDENPLAVGLAMAEVVTGVRLTAADLRSVSEVDWHPAPGLVYEPDH